MILPIVLFGSSILRKKCVVVKNFDDELISLIDNMWETMYAAHGVGLAAPQINKNLRLFIVDTSPFFEKENNSQSVKKVFINPQIIEETGDEWVFNEGCLSIPELREDISRKSSIKIEYLDQDFNMNVDHFNGVNARVIQHEYDHINGVLFIDKLSTLRKRMMRGRLNDISKGKISIDYKTKVVK